MGERFDLRQSYTDFNNVLRELAKADADVSVLRRYPGTGGLKQLLLDTETLNDWGQGDLAVREEVLEAHRLLKAVFGERYGKVIDSLRSSVLTSFYTPVDLVDVMLEAVVGRYGNGVNFLDPSAGSGIFIDKIREKDPDAHVTAIEKDLLAALVLQRIFQGDTVLQKGFEDHKAIKSFDLVSSNIPFGPYRVADDQIYREGNAVKIKSTTRIHNYFFVKGLDHLRDKGMLAFVTSTGVMDSPTNREVRKYLVSNANLLAAVRLPNDVFSSKGTRVVTDVIVLQKDEKKLGRLSGRDNDFIETVKHDVEGVGVNLSRYYQRNQQHILGSLSLGGQYDGETLDVIKTSDAYMSELKYALQEGVSAGQSTDRVFVIEQVGAASTLSEIPEGYPYRTTLKDGSIVALGGLAGVVEKENGKIVFKRIDSMRDAERVMYLHNIRGAFTSLVAAEMDTEDVDRMDSLRKEMNRLYTEFLFRYGNLNSVVNRRLINADPDGFKLLSLETLKGNDYVKGDIFERRVNNVAAKLSAKSLQDAIIISLNSLNRVDIPLLASLLEKSENEVIQQGLMTKEFFIEPLDKGYRFAPRDLFLSGNVVEKLERLDRIEFEAPFTDGDNFTDHKRELESVLPVRLSRENIDINLGVRWVPTDVYQEFAEYLFDAPAVVKRDSSSYYLMLKRSSPRSEVTYAATTNGGTIGGGHIFEYAVQDTIPKLTIRIDENTTVPDFDGMKSVELKVNEIKKAWVDFTTNVRKDVSTRLVDIYNKEINNFVPRRYDGSHLKFAELKGFEPKKTQVDAVWKVLQEDGGLIDHVVGAGKTLVIVLAAIKMKQLGVANKPLILCLKSNVDAIANTFKECYPSARVLAPKENDFKKGNRKALFTKMAVNEWDAIIITHDNYKALQHDVRIVERVDGDEIALLRADINALQGDASLSKRVLKGLEQRKLNLEAKMKIRTASIARDDIGYTFQQIGFDHIFVDESHEFKNLPFTTRQGNIPGLGTPEGSDRARNLLYGVRTIQEIKGGDKGITFLSGTPISNSMVELYLLKKYLRVNKLQNPSLNLVSFDAWSKMFAKKSINFEFSVTGEIKPKMRYRQFVNLPELAMWYKDMAHVVTNLALKDEKPTLEHVMVNIEPSADQEDFIKRLIMFAKTKDGGHIGMILGDNEKQAYMLLATNLAKKMSIDMRLIDGEKYSFDPAGKLAKMCEVVAAEYRSSTSFRGTQMIFGDLGTPGSKGFNVYGEIKRILIEVHGLPAEEIQFVHDYKTNARKTQFTKDMNHGKIRVALGSTKVGGTGINPQYSMIAVHHYDFPWTPKDIEQRDGRLYRQGAEMVRKHRGNVAKSYFYAVNRTLDPYCFTILKNKQSFILQIKTNTTDRKIDEGSFDEQSGVGYAEFEALLSGNTDLLQKAKLDKEYSMMEHSYTAFQTQKQATVVRHSNLLREIETVEQTVDRLSKDAVWLADHDSSVLPLMVAGVPYMDRQQIGEKLFTEVAAMVRTHPSGSVVDVAAMGIFKLKVKTYVAFSETGLAIPYGKVFAASDNGTVINYADGELNNNPVLAGGYLYTAVNRIPTILANVKEDLDKKFKTRDALVESMGGEFPDREKMQTLRVSCDELNSKIERDSLAAEMRGVGGQPTAAIDLFQAPESLPKNVQKILLEFGDFVTYKKCENLLKVLEPLGYTFEYGLDAVPYDLRVIGSPGNDERRLGGQKM